MAKYVGKIAWCSNKSLRIGDKSTNSGHYVYVRKKTKIKLIQLVLLLL